MNITKLRELLEIKFVNFQTELIDAAGEKLEELDKTAMEILREIE